MPVTHRVSELLIVLCDECGADITVVDDTQLPGGWREVYMKGWFGAMHACSELCEVDIRKRYEKTKEEVPPCA